MLTAIVFRETTTIGLRYQEVARACLEREIVVVETPVGPVRFKIARRGADVLNAVAGVRRLRPAGRRAVAAGQAGAGAGRRGLLAVAPVLVRHLGRRSCTHAYVPLLPDHRHRLRQQPAAPRARRTRRSPPTSSRATSVCAASTTHFLMGNDEHSQNVYRRAPRARPRPDRRTATRWSGSSATSGGGSTSRSTTSSARPRSGTASA